MTTVRLLLDQASSLVRAAGKMLGAILVSLASQAPLAAQGPPVHWHHAGAMPPGAIGSQRLGRGGPLSGYFQPVRIRAASGAHLALANGGDFMPPEAASLMAGMLIGPVYRLRVTHIPHYLGHEVFPTVELIDRLYPPTGQARRFPIPIEITQEDLEMALDGKFVTRVIYVEDPERALPHTTISDTETPDTDQPGSERQNENFGDQQWFEARAGQNPLVVADRLGRPVAILRLGGRVPLPGDRAEGFFSGSPPAMSIKAPRRRPPLPLPAAVSRRSAPRSHWR